MPQRPLFAVLAGLALATMPGVIAASADRSPVLRASDTYAALVQETLPVRDVILAQLGGPAVVVGHENDVAFMGVGSVVHSFNVSDPARPARIGASDVMTGRINDIVVSGSIVYVAHDGGLTLLDARDPVRLPITDTWDKFGARGSVTIHDHYAIVLGSGETFRSSFDVVLDVADPWSIRLVNDAWPPGSKQDFAVVGDRAYATFNFFLYIYDMSDPPWPVETLRLFMDDHALAVAADGDFVYVGRKEDLLVLDAADPRAFPMPTPPPGPGDPTATPAVYSPVQEDHPTAIVTTDGPVNHIVLRDDLAFIAAGMSGGFLILDISDGAHPVTLATVPAGDARHVELIDNFAYVSAGGEGVVIFDISDPSEPQRLEAESVTAWADTLDVIRYGDIAYVAGGSSGILAVNLTDSEAPTLVGREPDAAQAERLAQSGDQLFAIGGPRGGPGHMSIMDVSDPTSPLLIGSVETEGSGEGISVDAGLAFIADGSAGLQIYDITGVALPSRVAEMGASEWNVIDILVSGNYAYAVDQSVGLRVIDVTDPNVPMEIAQLPYHTELSSRGIGLVGSMLLVAGATEPKRVDWLADQGPEDLLAIDVSDPREPKIAEIYGLPEAYPRGISGDPEHVLVASSGVDSRSATSESNVIYIDRDDPTSSWTTNMPEGAWAVAEFDQYAAVAAGAGGLVSITTRRDVVPTPTPDIVPSPWATITRPPVTRTATPTREFAPTATAPPTPTGLWVIRDRIYLPVNRVPGL